MTKCRSCGAEIIWATSDRRRPMPVDPVPVITGNLVLEETKTGPNSTAYDPDKHMGRQRYVSHFSSCPDAKSHRRAR